MVELALLGVGNWGQNYLREAEKIPNLKVKYIFSATPQTLKHFSNQYIKVINYRQLLKDKSLDGVIIATPSSTHFKLAREFIGRGFNVLIEKPLAMSSKEAQQLLKLSKRKKSVVMVGHLQLYNPAFLKVVELIKNIGTVRVINFQAHNSPVRIDCSIIWDWGPHFVSMCLEVTKTLPQKVLADIANNHAYIKFNFEGDISAVASLDWTAKKRRRILTILGDDGFLILNDDSAKKIALVRFFPKLSLSYPKYSKKSALQNELQQFIVAIQSKIQPKTNLENGLELTKLIESIERSNV